VNWSGAEVASGLVQNGPILGNRRVGGHGRMARG
jgi:hypothetical protein